MNSENKLLAQTDATPTIDLTQDNDFQSQSIIALEEGADTSSQIAQTAPLQLPPALTAQQIKNFPNFAFQLNQYTIKPDQTTTLPQIHATWGDDLYRLEVHHSYIQWLFPLFEPGMNSAQPPLTQQEADLISQSDFAKANMIKSFHLMLNFWGFEYDQQANVVNRHQDAEHVIWAFKNWMNTHNDLRVSRCMRSLYITGQKEAGFAFFKALFKECHPSGYPAATGLRFALDKFWFPVFETDPLFQDECVILRADMKTWPVQKRGAYW